MGVGERGHIRKADIFVILKSKGNNGEGEDDMMEDDGEDKKGIQDKRKL